MATKALTSVGMETVDETVNRAKSMLSSLNTAKVTPPGTSATPSPIDATSIGTPDITVPTVPVDSTVSNTASQIEGQAASALTPQETPTPEAPTAQPTSSRDWVTQQMQDLFVQGQMTSPETQRLQQDAAQANLEARDWATRLTAYSAATRNEVNRLRTNPEGKLVGALNAQIANYEYDRYNSKDGLADMAIAASFAQNRAQYANELATAAVDAEEKKYNRQMSFFSQLYTMLGDDMTDSEAKQYDAMMSIYQGQVEGLMNAKTAAMQRAAAAGAPSDVILGIKNAQSAEDVWAAAGQYGEDPNLKLARDKFYWDVQYAKQKMALDARLAQGELDQKTYNDNKQKEITKKELGKSFDAIGRILNNSIGFGAATGKITGRTAGFFDLGAKTGTVGAAGGLAFGPVGAAVGGVTGLLTGGVFGASEAKEQQEEIANDMDYITSALTTQRIGVAKSLGLTGAMSDRDIKLIGDSADVLVSAWDNESMTFRGDPNTIKKHLNTLKTTIDENIEMIQLEQEFNL